MQRSDIRTLNTPDAQKLAVAAFMLAIAWSLVASPHARAQSTTLSVPHLLRNLESDKPGVAASAARTLGVIFAPGGRGGEDKAGAVAKMIKHLASPKSPEIRRQCAIALGRIQAKEASEPMKQALKDKDVSVVLAAGKAVAQIMPADQARTFLTEVGKDTASLARVGAYNGIAEIAKPADAAFLLEGVSSENWRAQEASIRGLERSVRSGASLSIDQYKTVAKALGADTRNAANAAVHFFSHLHSPNAIAALTDAADPEAHPDNWRQRAMALRAIRHRDWPRMEEQLPVVMRNLGDRTANVTNEVHGIMNHLRKERRVRSSTFMPVLVTELERAKPLRRRAAILASMSWGIEKEFASRIAVVAAKTLTEAAGKKEEWNAQAQALHAIGMTGYTGVMSDVAKSVNSNVPNVRREAGEALKRLGPICPPDKATAVAPILQPLLTTAADWRKAAVAAGAVGHYANEKAVAALTDLLAHSVLNVQRGASQSLVVIAEEEDKKLKGIVDGAIYKRLENSPASWQFGAPVLAALNDVKALPLLTRMLGSRDWRTQESAAIAAFKLAQNHPIKDPALAKALVAASQSEVLQVQRACDTTLRELAKQNDSKK